MLFGDFIFKFYLLNLCLLAHLVHKRQTVFQCISIFQCGECNRMHGLSGKESHVRSNQNIGECKKTCKIIICDNLT